MSPCPRRLTFPGVGGRLVPRYRAWHPRDHLAGRHARLADEMGRAWLRHNVVEVGNLQFFLPQLYEAERRKR